MERGLLSTDLGNGLNGWGESASERISEGMGKGVGAGGTPAVPGGELLVLGRALWKER